MRNASGLTAADLARAQGFQECAEVLSNAQNFQQNMAQSHNGLVLNAVAQNGGNTQPAIQGRSSLNGVPNRKRSFDGMEANPVKKARPNGLVMQPVLLNSYGPQNDAAEAQMESVNMEMAAALTSGGPGPFAYGLNGVTPPQGQGPMDQGEDQDRSSPATKELEVITVASMQTPCRCTNSYAYL